MRYLLEISFRQTWICRATKLVSVRQFVQKKVRMAQFTTEFEVRLILFYPFEGYFIRSDELDKQD